MARATPAAETAATNGHRPGSLRASARRIDLGAKRTTRIAQMGGPRQEWQAESWGYYDTSAEAGNAIMYAGNQMAKLRLFAAVLEEADSDGLPIPADAEDSGVDAGLAEAAARQLARLRSPLGGQSEILRAMTMNLEAAGEGYVVGIMARDPSAEDIADAARTGKPLPEGTPERWDVVSIDEVETKGDGPSAKTTVKIDGEDKGVVLDKDKGDVIFRVWQRHPRWSTRADCAMRHCLPTLKLLNALHAQVLASTNSQMHAGILFMSSNMTFAGTPVTPVANDEHDQSPFEDALDDSFAIPLETPEDLFTIRPMVVFGTADDIAASKHMRLGRDVEERLDARIEQHTKGLARGLALPVEVVMGHQATTFANAEQVDQDTFDDYLEPRCRLVVDAITIGFLRPELEAEGYAPEQVERLVCWYDPGDLIGNPDTEGAADEGVKLGNITGEAWRRVKGFTEDDAPDESELLLGAVLRRGTIPPEITAAVLGPLGAAAGIEMPGPGDIAPAPLPGQQPAPAEPAPAEPEAVAAAARSQVPLGQRLTDIDTRLASRLTVAFSLAIERALERAGGRLRSKVGRMHADLIASTPNRDIARMLGEALVADAASDDELLAGAWSTLGPLYRKQVGQAQRDARSAAARRAPIQSGNVEATQADDVAEAWDWTEAELNQTVKRALFADVARDVLGESDPDFHSPAGLIRQSMARAGGQRGIEARGLDGGYVTTLAGSDNPAGGVATGTTMMEALRDAGVAVDGWVWRYGNAAHPFEPHEALDGVEYTDYDDPALTNDDVWPPFPHYFPGDHLGCTCQAEPTLILPDDGAGT